MMELLVHDCWVKIAGTAWFQIIITVLAATIVAKMTYTYARRGDRQKEINEALAQVFTTGRKYRDCYTSFAEYDSDFQKQQENLTRSIRNQSRDAIDIYKTASFNSQGVAMDYRRALDDARKDFLKSAFLLHAYLNRRLSKEEFQNHINKIIGYRLTQTKDFAKAKKEIDKNLLPVLEKLETLCSRILWEQNEAKLRIYYNLVQESFGKAMNGLKEFRCKK